jgi:hypothetical protein
MKRLTLFLASALLWATASMGQAVDDRAVIPVSVNLNSILRLNVTSGGNIDFNFNTLNDYEYGINTTGRYQTQFTVASSVNWNVFMFAEGPNLIGTDVINNADPKVMPIDNIGYNLSSTGTGANNYYFHAPAATDPATIVPLNNLDNTLLVGYDTTNPNAGDILRNAFTINWRCGTREGTMRNQTILSQGLAADRYTTNVFLVLKAVN